MFNPNEVDPSKVNMPREIAGRTALPTELGITTPPATSFAAGGAIDEATGDVNLNPVGGGGGMGMRLQRALAIVQDTLSYGRQLHGIGGDTQEAMARMPTVPGNPSESGQPRERPLPGPLPPTARPFGKRVSEADTGDGDFGQEQAIPTEDEDDEEMA